MDDWQYWELKKMIENLTWQIEDQIRGLKTDIRELMEITDAIDEEVQELKRKLNSLSKAEEER
jgi:uncharacterized protein YoxC